MEDFFDSPHTSFLVEVRTWSKYQCAQYIIAAGIVDQELSTAIQQEVNPNLSAMRILLNMDIKKLKSIIVQEAQYNSKQFV